MQALADYVWQMATSLFLDCEWSVEADPAGGNAASCMSFSRNNRFVAIGYTEEKTRKLIVRGKKVRHTSSDVAASVFDVSTKRWMCVRSLRAPQCADKESIGGIVCLAWANNERHLYAGTTNGYLVAWRVKTSEVVLCKKVLSGRIKKVEVAYPRCAAGTTRVLVVGNANVHASLPNSKYTEGVLVHYFEVDFCQERQRGYPFTVWREIAGSKEDHNSVIKSASFVNVHHVNSPTSFACNYICLLKVKRHADWESRKGGKRSALINPFLQVLNCDDQAESSEREISAPKSMKNLWNKEVWVEWQPGMKLLFVRAAFGSFFVDLQRPELKKNLYKNHMNNFKYACGTVVETCVNGGKQDFVVGVHTDTIPSQLCVWGRGSKADVEFYNGPSHGNLESVRYHAKNEMLVALADTGEVFVLRKKINFNLWGGSMYPARFQVISRNVEYTEREDAFDKSANGPGRKEGGSVHVNSTIENTGRIDVVVQEHNKFFEEAGDTTNFFMVRPLQDLCAMEAPIAEMAQGDTSADAPLGLDGFGLVESNHVPLSTGLSPHEKEIRSKYSHRLSQASENFAADPDNSTRAHFHFLKKQSQVDRFKVVWGSIANDVFHALQSYEFLDETQLNDADVKLKSMLEGGGLTYKKLLERASGTGGG